MFFKLETLQPPHSSKVRGAFNALMQLSHEQRKRGVVTASDGNHGLAIAYAAHMLDIPATVYFNPGEDVVVVLYGENVALENVRRWAACS